jgi:tryptophan halogenase
MAAVAIARRLPHVRVTHLNTRDGEPLEDALGAARPSIRTFHDIVGIDEAEVITHTRGAYRLGTSVQGWTNSGYFRGHGLYGEPLGGVPFHQLWLRAREAGKVGPYDAFSVAAALASRARFAFPSPDPASPFAALDYGLQLNLPAYAHALQELGRAAGVQEIAGHIETAERSADGASITALRLDDGHRLTADLVVDASGCSAIARRLLPSTWIDWSATLPVDRLIVARESPNRVPPPSDRLLALPVGWRYEARTMGGTVHLLGYTSAHLSDAHAHQALHSDTGCEADDPPFVLRQGRLAEPWTGNCVAIGAAAVTIEPSAATGLHLVCRHIERLIAYWPGRDCTATPVEVAVFNRRMALEAERIRDFTQLPYLLTQRPEAFWRNAANGPVSQELARDLALFRERGRLVTHDEDAFERDEWLASLIGLGVRPRRTDPLADAIPPNLAEQHLVEAAARLRRAVDETPTHAQWLRRLAASTQ